MRKYLKMSLIFGFSTSLRDICLNMPMLFKAKKAVFIAPICPRSQRVCPIRLKYSPTSVNRSLLRNFVIFFYLKISNTK